MTVLGQRWRARPIWATCRSGPGGPAAAQALKAASVAEGIAHVHVHSCGRATLIAALARHLGGPGYPLTLHEPLGVAYMEAIACGSPAIGTAAGGVPELIDDGVEGLPVPPKDPEALAAALLRVAGDPDLARRLSETGRARIERDYRASLGAEVIVAEMRLYLANAGGAPG